MFSKHPSSQEVHPLHTILYPYKIPKHIQIIVSVLNMLNIFKVLFCLNAVFVQSKSSREYPSLHRSRRLSSTDICTLKTEVIHPTDFVRNHVCKNMMIREFIEQSICDGVSDCFKCDTENVRIVGESSLTVAKCNIIPELNLIDRHMASHLCYGLASEHTWNMCVSEKNFNLLHCPAVTLFMGKYN